MSGDLARPTDKLFTGQQKDPDTTSALGLYNYGAHFYRTLTGRFVSPGPLVADRSEAMKQIGGALTVTPPASIGRQTAH